MILFKLLAQLFKSDLYKAVVSCNSVLNGSNVMHEKITKLPLFICLNFLLIHILLFFNEGHIATGDFQQFLLLIIIYTILNNCL